MNFFWNYFIISMYNRLRFKIRYETLIQKIGILMKVGSINFRAVITSLSLLVYVLVITTNILGSSVCAKASCNVSFQFNDIKNCGSCSENSNEPTELVSSGITSSLNLYYDCSCAACFSPAKSFNEYESFIKSNIPERIYSEIHIPGKFFCQFTDVLSGYEKNSSRYPVAVNSIDSLKTVVLLV